MTSVIMSCGVQVPQSLLCQFQAVRNHAVTKCIVICIRDLLCTAGRYYAYLWDKTCATKICIQVRFLRGWLVCCLAICCLRAPSLQYR